MDDSQLCGFTEGIGQRKRCRAATFNARVEPVTTKLFFWEAFILRRDDRCASAGLKLAVGCFSTALT
jgi:hypothetical protein